MYCETFENTEICTNYEEEPVSPRGANAQKDQDYSGVQGVRIWRYTIPGQIDGFLQDYTVQRGTPTSPGT